MDRQPESIVMTAVADPQAELRLVRTAQRLDPAIVTAQPSFLAAIKLCVSLGGFENEKPLAHRLDIDPGHWSRIMSGSAHFPTDKVCDLMDLCGNEAPLLWLMYHRGYDLACLRKRETETERTLRETMEQLDRERDRNRYLAELLSGRKS